LEPNYTTLPKEKVFFTTCSTSVKICKKFLSLESICFKG
jgi:hypothetical protein